jgi:hypothetical protein
MSLGLVVAVVIGMAFCPNIVMPETIIDWHPQGFRWYWTWKVRHGQSGHQRVPKETRDLIRTMSRDNPLWGAPRIHGELLKLGITLNASLVGVVQ